MCDVGRQNVAPDDPEIVEFGPIDFVVAHTTQHYLFGVREAGQHEVASLQTNRAEVSRVVPRKQPLRGPGVEDADVESIGKFSQRRRRARLHGLAAGDDDVDHVGESGAESDVGLCAVSPITTTGASQIVQCNAETSKKWVMSVIISAWSGSITWA